MGDPLSIASGIAGLVSLGLTICNGLYTYFNAIKDSLMDEAGPSQKWRKQISAARYPLNQKKLFQLHEQLLNANNVLGNFVQGFNLDVNTSISNDLQVLKGDIKAGDANTHAMLRSIANHLEIIGPAVKRTDMALVTLSSQDRVGSISTSKTPVERALQPLYIRNSEMERKLGSKSEVVPCHCRGLKNRSGSYRSNRTHQFWGGLVISRQGGACRTHLPGCTFFKHSVNRSKATLTYLGLRYIFSRSLTVSLTWDYPPGAYRLFFGLNCSNIVESSPAFHVFDIATDSEGFIRTSIDTIGLEGTAKKIIKELTTIYNSGAASPSDVDSDGNNIAHYCVRVSPFFWPLELMTVS
ncbi:hypothetical protein IL306_001008 [Fusarium sp. DS 682]|nr:hypothetical protein IL306_001008 [Fusarium sp. DS 682]